MSSNKGPDVAQTLEGQLGGVVSVAQNGFPLALNHFAYYVQDDGVFRNAVVISNTDLQPDHSTPEGADNRVTNALSKSLKFYEEKADEKVSKVGYIVGAEPKLSDYRLMQMCGVLDGQNLHL